MCPQDSDAEKDTPSKHGRKKIRRVISKGKLQEETVRAAKEEKERRKRIADKRKMVKWSIVVIENSSNCKQRLENVLC